MNSKYLAIGITIMCAGAVLTGALQNIIFSASTGTIIKTLIGYAIMGAGIFLAKRSFGSSFELKQFGFALILMIIGGAINGVLFRLIDGDAVTYVKYFSGLAALSIGALIGKNSFGGDDPLFSSQ